MYISVNKPISATYHILWKHIKCNSTGFLIFPYYQCPLLNSNFGECYCVRYSVVSTIRIVIPTILCGGNSFMRTNSAKKDLPASINDASSIATILGRYPISWMPKQADPNGIRIVRIGRLTHQSVSADICTSPLFDVMPGLGRTKRRQALLWLFEH